MNILFVDFLTLANLVYILSNEFPLTVWAVIRMLIMMKVMTVYRCFWRCVVAAVHTTCWQLRRFFHHS